MGNTFSNNSQQTQINDIRRDVDDLKTAFQDRAQRIETDVNTLKTQMNQILTILTQQQQQTSNRPTTLYRQQQFQDQRPQLRTGQLHIQSAQGTQTTSQETRDSNRESNGLESSDQRDIRLQQAFQGNRSGPSNVDQLYNIRDQQAFQRTRSGPS